MKDFLESIDGARENLIDFHPRGDVARARSDSVGVVVGLQMTEYIMKSGRFMGEGNAALTRAFVDDRADAAPRWPRGQRDGRCSGTCIRGRSVAPKSWNRSQKVMRFCRSMKSSEPYPITLRFQVESKCHSILASSLDFIPRSM